MGKILVNICRGASLLSPLPLLYLVHQRQQQSQGDKGSGWEDHQYDRLITGTENRETKKLTGAEQFTDTAQDKEDQGKAGTHAKTIGNGMADRMF